MSCKHHEHQGRTNDGDDGTSIEERRFRSAINKYFADDQQHHAQFVDCELPNRQTRFAKGRRFAIVGVCAVAAVITPPDPISMLSMAVPLAGLYEIAILAVRLLEKRRVAAKAAKDAAEAAGTDLAKPV